MGSCKPHWPYRVFAMMVMCLVALCGCRTTQATGNPLADARVLCSEQDSLVIIPTSELIRLGFEIDDGHDVFGARIDDGDPWMAGSICSIDIKGEDGRVNHPILDERWEPAIEGMYYDPFPYGQNLTAPQRRYREILRQSCNLTVYQPVTFDGNSIIIPDCGTGVFNDRPPKAVVYLRLNNGTMLESIVDIEYVESLSSSRPTFELNQ